MWTGSQNFPEGIERIAERCEDNKQRAGRPTESDGKIREKTGRGDEEEPEEHLQINQNKVLEQDPDLKAAVHRRRPGQGVQTNVRRISGSTKLLSLIKNPSYSGFNFKIKAFTQSGDCLYSQIKCIDDKQENS